MCDFCKLASNVKTRHEDFEKGNIKWAFPESIAKTKYTNLRLSYDENGFYIYASGDDATPDYYINYCPECGKKL